jgi:HEF_HK domain/Histidine kinase-, DNA gyrase B-, and HSP90-like ATPase
MPVFKARARTVDLLGRQQIAGIPTAISELFKNAHDAYATCVDVDFLRSRRLLILRDDGVGMSREDFEERWLTLGTESKVDAKRGLAPPPKIGNELRPILGEKGIGRLAIASIGSQVLVLTRGRRGRSLTDLTAALVNWRLFEIPGINLDQVNVPILELPGGQLPDRVALDQLCGQLEAEIDKLGLSKAEAGPIRADLEDLDFDPAVILQFLGEPTLEDHGYGTQFLITPTNEQLAVDIDLEPTPGDPSATLVQTLIGFANTMTPGSPEPKIETAFRDWRDDETSVDLIARDEFFTPEDFLAADHRIVGRFDDLGVFHGTVSIYGREEEPYEVAWPRGKGRELRCGPFDFQLAYVQGEAAESRLDLATHGLLTQKLLRIGGLYIYRNGVRVLPYGTPGYDFLGIERRRTLNIGRYFFSYRRMFGVVELTSGDNGALHEKAGREGFQENGAYRDFREVLQNLLIQIAADFFSSRGARNEAFVEGRDAARKRNAVRADFDKRADRERKAFARRVGGLLSAIEDGTPQLEAAGVVDRTGAAVAGLDATAPVDRAAELEVLAIDELEALRRKYLLSEPVGFGLDRDLRRNWEWLRARCLELEEAVWLPALRQIAEITARTGDAPGGEGRRSRLSTFLRRTGQLAVERVSRSADDLRRVVNDAVGIVSATADVSIAAVADAVEGTLADADADPLETVADADYVDLRTRYERIIQSRADDEEGRLSTLAERVRAAVATNGGMVASAADLTGALDEELIYLREQTTRDNELAQLGLATEVISHEVGHTLRGIRDSLNRLHAWTDVNPALADLHADLAGDFEHLDSYLALFTPMQRRARRRHVEIKGFEVAEYLGRLFDRRFEEDEIELRVTDAFRTWRRLAYRSTIYPVLVNLVDNASYWVTQRPAPRWIELDADGRAILVSDSGPGITGPDEDAIWEYGFSRKPGGRGAGLHIAREVLARDDWEILVDPPQRDRGALFRIQPKESDDPS